MRYMQVRHSLLYYLLLIKAIALFGLYIYISVRHSLTNLYTIAISTKIEQQN